VSFDLARIVDRSRKVAGQLNAGVKGLMKKNKIPVVEGEGALAGKGKLKVAKDGKTTELAAKHIIVATGPRPRPPLREGGRRQDLDLPPRHGAQGDADEAPGHRLRRDRGGVCQLLFGHGAEVTIVEMLDRILPVEDADVSAFVHKALTKQGMKLHVTPGVDKARSHRHGVRAATGTGGVGGDSATPSSPSASCRTPRISASKRSASRPIAATSSPTAMAAQTSRGIYAIGDVTGPPWLAHKASHEGVICVEAIAG
jgi:dihydrolipoamide dehydrogenase